MLYLLVLLTAINVAFRERIIRVDVLEFNHVTTGTNQLIAWEYRNGVNWPADWTTSPSGKLSGNFWMDANGKVVFAKEVTETWTFSDPERQAYNFWQQRGETRGQGGIWK